jgi:hypothetical protein
VANLKHDNLWVVGGKPDWYTGNHIPVAQNMTKYDNAKANMEAIAKSEKISDDFILMNDDFFIISKVIRLNSYHSGFLRDRIKELRSVYRTSSYLTLLNGTLRYLKRRGIQNPLNYALHVPFPMNKKKLLPLIELGFSWRILYGNLYNVGGVEVTSSPGQSKDVKLYVRKGELSPINRNSISKKFLSSQDDSFDILLPQLQAMFPEPSQYEKK